MPTLLAQPTLQFAPPAAPAKFQPVFQRIDRWASRQPDAVAVSGQGRQMTFRELRRHSREVSRRLRQSGVRHGDRVGVWADGDPRIVPALLGIHRAGAAYLPLDPTAPAARLAGMMEEAEVKIVLASQPEKVALGEHDAEVQPAIQNGKPIIIRNRLQRTIGPQVTHDVAADDLAYVIYTSGSTGKPKGVAVTHGNLNWLIEANEAYFGRPVVRFLDVMPLYFDLSVAAIFWTLATGGSVCLPGVGVRRSASEIADLLASEASTHAVFIPSVWARVLDVLEARQVELPELQCVTLCGEPCPLPLARHHQRLMPQVEMHNMYGPTEATVWCSGFAANQPFEDGRDFGTVPIGEPMSQVRLYLLDENLQPVAEGESGELFIAGAGVAQGYFRRPELTDERFLVDHIAADGGRMYRTGDICRLWDDGQFEFLCRRDDEIKLRGHRITLGEIEAALHEHEQIEQAAVVVREAASGAKSLAAFAIAKSAGLDTATALDFVAQRLPAYMVPSTLELVDALPRLPNGKVNRKELKAQVASLEAASSTQEGQAASPSPILSQGERELGGTQAKLHGIWRELLGREVAADESFFDAGGDSLMAMDLMLEVERHWNQRLSITTLLERPTIAHFAGVIDSGEQAAWSPLVPLEIHEGKRPFYLIHPGGGSVLCYRDLLRHLGDARSFYGLQAPGVDGVLEPLATVEEAATMYLAAIRDAQPHGPYALAGWSFGGLIAYEIGRRLHDDGEPIELIGLVETGLLYGLHVIKQLFAGSETPLFMLAGLDLSSELDDFRQHATLGQIVPEGAADKVVERIFRVFIANGIATRDYRPDATTAPLTLFTAEEPLAPKQAKKYNPRKDWSALAENIDEVIVPGNHLTLLVEPHAQVLAREIKAALERSN